MTDLIERDAAIDSHLENWTPTLILRDNERPDSEQQKEFIRLTVLEGQSVIARRAGVLTVNGTVTRYPVSLYFDVFTELNTGTRRSSVLCQEVVDHWHIKQLTPSFLLFEPRIERIGEEKKHLHHVVVIDGYRDHRHTR